MTYYENNNIPGEERVFPLYCAHKKITWKGKIKRRETGGGGAKIN